MEDVFNVKDYGAVGNGIADDTNAINQALEAARDAGGGIVVIPSGVYSITNSLCVYSNIWLQLNPNATILRSANLNPMLLNGPRNSAVQYYGFEGEGNIRISGGVWDAQGQIYNGVNGQHIALGHGENITIENATFINPYGAHVMEINACRDVRVLNCLLKDFHGDRSTNYREAIQIDFMSKGGVGWPSPPWFGALDETFSEGILIQGCTIKNFQRGIGSHSSINGKHYKNISIVDNHFEDIDLTAIRAENWLNVVISNNKMINVGAGIEMYTKNMTASGEYTIANNIIDMSGNAPSISPRGIYLNGNNSIEYIYDAELNGNIVIGANLENIRFEYCKNCSVVGGNVKSSNSNGISVVDSEDIRISGVSSSYNSIQGLLIYKSVRTVVTGCIVHHNGIHGITLNQNANNNTIVGNLVHSNNQTGASTSNIRISVTSLNNSIQGNSCRKGSESKMPHYGISLSSDSTGNLIVNNDLLDSGSIGAIDDPGSVAITTVGNRVS